MRKTVLVLTLAVLVCVPVLAQQTASIRGTVIDSQQETLAGATVSAVNVSTGLERKGTSNAAGIYNIPDLPVGTYVVTAEAEGFKTGIVQNVVLNVGDTRELEIQLEVGAVTEAVTVTSSAIVVETIGGEVAGLITGEQVRELPLNGRNFLQLTQLMPGVVTMDNFDTKNKGLLAGSDMSVAGSRATGNMVTVDGANNQDVGSNRTILVYPSLEALEEFKIHRNSYGAEFGGAGGAQVSLVTKGGTNDLRGSVFYFARRGSWNETNYILERVGASPDDLTRDDYGFTIGGAFIKDKLHFFASTEWNEEVRGVARSANAPTAAEKSGNFSGFSCLGTTVIDPATGQPFPNNQIPADRIGDAGRAYIDLYPDANLTGQCPNWVSSIDVPIDWNQINARLDWSITDSARLMARYTVDDWTDSGPTAGDSNGLWGDDAFPSVDSSWAQPSESIMLQLNNVIGASALNTVTLSQVGNEINIGQYEQQSGLQEEIRSTNPPSFPADIKLSYPNTAYPLFWGTGGLDALWQQGPWNNDQDMTVFKDDYEQVFGKHVFKAGVLYTDAHKAEPPRNSSAEMQAYWGATGLAGTWSGGTGNVVADFLLDDMAWGFSEISTNVPADVSWKDYEAYAADSWKIKDNMTFDFGVRYTRFDWPTNADANLYANAQPDLWNPAFGTSPCNGTLQVPGVDPCGAAGFEGALTGPNDALIDNHSYFAPRLGFAWDVFSNGNSVLRAGFGQFYQRERVSINLVELLQNPPNVNLYAGDRTLDGDYEGLSLSAGYPSRGIDRNLETPYLYQYNLTWEQRVGRDSTVELSYVGSQGHDLIRIGDQNVVPLGVDTDNNGVPDRLDFIRCPGGDDGASCRGQYLGINAYGSDNQMQVWTSDGTSDYNSLQAQYILRFGRGSQFQTSYTWAWQFDANASMRDSSGEIGNANSVTDIYNPQLDDSIADMYREHVWNASLIYNLPTFAGEGGVKEWLMGNWAIGGIAIYSSGQPLAVYGGTNTADDNDLSGSVPGDIGYDQNVRPIRTGASCAGSGDLGLLNPAAYTWVGWRLGDTTQQAGRNLCEGPDFFQVDLSIYKNLPFSNRFNVQLRFEMFNIFNTVNLMADGANLTYDPPIFLNAPRAEATTVVGNGSPTNINYGQATRARDARQIQLGVKFTF